MIKATELRVGNKIQVGTGKNKGIVFTILPEEDLETIYKFPKNYDPVILTDEWLVRFGARVKEGRRIIQLNEKSFLTFEESIFEDKTGWDAFIIQTDGQIVSVDYVIRFVHQFQNLYHALTGEELILKP